ncbi:MULTISPECIES: hypothetical protein [unclassified Corynebacterium]|uniref:hypothetical protein n=1 Tax=unclassified Corynebacterium TaxID=2624378 RepID=UPI00309A3622
MFGLFKKSKKSHSTFHEAAAHTDTPLSNEMTILMAQELPILDSASRIRVHEILREYDGPEITRQEDLPAEIKVMLGID